MTKPKITAEQLAQEHWVWLETVLRKMYTNAFVHGYKHGKDSRSKQ